MNQKLFPIPMPLAALAVGVSVPFILILLEANGIELTADGYKNEQGEWMDVVEVHRAILS